MWMIGHPDRPEILVIDSGSILLWSVKENPPMLLAQASCTTEALCAFALDTEGAYFAASFAIPEELRQAGPNGASAPCEIELRRWGDLSLSQSMTVPGSGVCLTSLSFSPDGRWLATASLNEDICLIERQPGKAITQLYSSEYTSAFSFDPTSRFLAVGGTSQSRGFISLFELRDTQLLPVIENYGNSSELCDTLFSLQISTNRKRLAVHCTAREAIRVYDLRSGELQWSISPDTLLADSSQITGDHHFFSDIQFAADDTVVVCGDGNGDLLLFAQENGHLLARVPTGSSYPLKVFYLEPSGKAVWTLQKLVADSKNTSPYQFHRILLKIV